MHRALAQLVLTLPALAGEPALNVSGPVYDSQRGVHRYTLHSGHQKGETLLEVLLPDRFDPARPHRVLYVLPVETGIGGRYGDGLMEFKGTGLHNRHDLIAATLSFDTLPWYVDHPTEPRIAQESYLKQVVALVESKYKTPGTRDGRLLVGFSKSGWGAVSLLLRNPDFFGRAAAWDAPLALADEDWKNFGIPQASGTRAVFSRLNPRNLVPRLPEAFKQSPPRLVITGEANFGPNPANRYAPDGHTRRFHDLLLQHHVPHAYDDDLKTPHVWNVSWLRPTVELLLKTDDGLEAQK